MSSYKPGEHRDGKPKVLKQRDIPSLAKYIQSNKCENIILMLGAGVSTSAGIPDFRSPGTGLYSNLQRLNLPRPEAVFEINFFRKNPVPFYTLAHELFPGKFRPTITHSFIRLLHEKGLLYMCFTQNIDTLERRAGVPDEKIIEAHGSFASQRCIDCRRTFDDEKMKEHINSKTIAKCESCGGYVKPDIVFFGEALPPQFISSINKMYSADLLIVMGTSLTVHPFATLAEIVPDACPRVLINLDQVGDFGDHSDDLILLGHCDAVIKELSKELGWEEELNRLWAETEFSVEGAETKGKGKRDKGKYYEPTWEEPPNVLEDLALNLENLAVDEQASTPKASAEKPLPASAQDTPSRSSEAKGDVPPSAPSQATQPSKEDTTNSGKPTKITDLAPKTDNNVPPNPTSTTAPSHDAVDENQSSGPLTSATD